MFPFWLLVVPECAKSLLHATIHRWPCDLACIEVAVAGACLPMDHMCSCDLRELSEEACDYILPALCVFKQNEPSLRATCLGTTCHPGCWGSKDSVEATLQTPMRCSSNLLVWGLKQPANICFDRCRSLKLPCNLMKFLNFDDHDKRCYGVCDLSCANFLSWRFHTAT